MSGMSKTFLRCRECKKEYDSTFKYICDECFGPLDVHYNFPPITKDTFTNREQTYWRYFELLPIIDKSNIVSISAGMTPLVRAEKLGKEIGLNNLYIKNDSVNPTFSFKDRPAGVAISKAKEFGLSSVGCASTGNLAAATAAHAAKGNFPCYIFAPSDIENAKIAQALSYGANYISVDGTYDDANRIAAQIGDSKGVGIVNINMRSYYVEGSKTLAYEVAEQLDWKIPDQLIVPTGSGAMLNAICKGFEELETVSLVDNVSGMHMNCAQAHGCAPIVDAFKNNSDDVIPVELPDTVAKSLAIEYAKKKITINCVSPGFIQSKMTDNIVESIKAVLTSRIPMSKLGTGEDVSNTVAFLSSDSASYITGETIHVNGGMYMA